MAEEVLCFVLTVLEIKPRALLKFFTVKASYFSAKDSLHRKYQQLIQTITSFLLPNPVLLTKEKSKKKSLTLRTSTSQKIPSLE
jgi:hypothetical protein